MAEADEMNEGKDEPWFSAMDCDQRTLSLGGGATSSFRALNPKPPTPSVASVTLMIRVIMRRNRGLCIDPLEFIK